MKFTCTQENLVRGLAQVSPVAGRNTQLPILQNILLKTEEGTLHLIGTDLEIGIHGVVGGKVEKEGVCVVPARQLFEYVQQLPTTHPIALVITKGGLVVSTEGFTATFPVAEEEDFPLLPGVEGKEAIEVRAQLLCQGLTQAIFAAAREGTRPEIHSVYIQGGKGELRVAATDSFRLAEPVLAAQGLTKPFSFLLPLATAQEIVRLFSKSETIQIVAQKTAVVFRADGIELTSRLVDATYPDYQQIIPQSWKTRVRLDREELTRALKTLTVFLPRDSRRVHIRALPAKGEIELSVGGGGLGQGDVRLSGSVEGEEVEVLCNIYYLLEGLQHVQGEHCEMWLGGEDQPIVFRPANKELHYVYVVMPIQG